MKNQKILKICIGPCWLELSKLFNVLPTNVLKICRRLGCLPKVITLGEIYCASYRAINTLLFDVVQH